MNLKNNIFFFALLFVSVQFLGQRSINFKHIVPKIKNSNFYIKQIAQDSLGNIWMTYADGILKYNGYGYQLIEKAKIFPRISENDQINDIETDDNKNIWISSKNGLLTKYSSKKGKFIGVFKDFTEQIEIFKTKNNKAWFVTKTGQLYNYNNNKTEIFVTIPNINGTDNIVQSIEIGNDNQVYVSTSKGKIYSYSNETKSLNELVGPYTDYPGPIVLQTDNYNKLWIGTEAFGLLIYDIKQDTFIQESFFKEKIKLVKEELFISFFLDSENNIWAGTDGDGLYKIKSKTGEILIYEKDVANNFSLSSNTIIDINEDNHKNIWIVTNYGILDIVPKINTDLKYHNGSINAGFTRTLSVYKSSTGKLWIGTDGVGLTQYDVKNDETKSFLNKKNNGFYVQSITEDINKNIWVGTYKNGLWYYNTNLKKFTKIQILNDKSQKATDVRTVFTDSKNRIWVGSNVSFSIYNQNRSLLASFNPKNTIGLMGSILESITEDENGNIWLGILGGGLFRFNENKSNIKKSTFTNYSSDDKEIVNGIRSMCFGKQNELWFISNLGNLFLFNTTSKTYKNYNSIKSLNTYPLSAIVSQNQNNLWISSSNGIHHYNTETQNLKTYSTTDGFQNNNYRARNSFKDREGFIYFGSNEGINYFDPTKIKKEKSDVKLFINEINVLNKPAKEILKNQISSEPFNVKDFFLENDQSSFSFKFSAIDNILNPNFSYSYRLNGFDKEWKTIYTEGEASYTNIPPGNYTLEIMANEMNSNLLISKKEVKITINKPI
ncbi:triple tyrosine motif-containing protein [Polaribacter ponticola]|uniref:Triple tyrosine motif-containing protein n=1 Tax=Polaribacter ponticola TaxID=2978475 RepID=A0ABT5SB52_9FLAO|nr:triple tyrosine motif-containing protein [Polaribacter sp. MSW5]MDD7915305.1 triple tyrosine motif-containing protein [Polaribacter sp. MSW5]